MPRGRRRNLRSLALPHFPRTIINVGDHVMMQPPFDDLIGKYYVAIIEGISRVNREDMRLHVRWFYHPEETCQGRQGFHGARELLISNHRDVQPPGSVVPYGCHVYSYTDYLRLDSAGSTDYFCRFNYDAVNLVITPGLDSLEKYCLCRQPNNPDRPMIRCDECSDWFHFDCIRMNQEPRPGQIRCAQHTRVNLVSDHDIITCHLKSE